MSALIGNQAGHVNPKMTRDCVPAQGVTRLPRF